MEYNIVSDNFNKKKNRNITAYSGNSWRIRHYFGIGCIVVTKYRTKKKKNPEERFPDVGLRFSGFSFQINFLPFFFQLDELDRRTGPIEHLAECKDCSENVLLIQINLQRTVHIMTFTTNCETQVFACVYVSSLFNVTVDVMVTVL